MKKSSIILASVILLNALTGVAATAAEKTYTTNGQIEFIESTTGTKPLDPENPDNPFVPEDPTKPENKPDGGTSGPVSIDYASSLVFGQQVITSETKTYHALLQNGLDSTGAAAKRANYVQVSDNRGTEAGWHLTVTQSTQFKTGAGSELTAAEITLGNGTLVTNSTSTAPTATSEISLVPGEPSTVMSATVGQGAGTYITKWGDTEAAAAESISLEIPGGTKKEKAVYTTSFVWTLSDVPA
ncbi:hypothetical protein IGI37_003808 [Enterococcus sp. AZ194]|uniref:WxL domain-containing protein n=1 Tax=Enterococcus sp. AZ194 TaxID=2774629 RepID=UPI003F209824